MKIDFKKPKYVLPIIVLPFFFLLNYGYKSFSKEDVKVEAIVNEIQSIGDVSDQVKKNKIDHKLDAYRNRYKNRSDNSGLNDLKLPVQQEEPGAATNVVYNSKEKRLLDSIDNVLSQEFSRSQTSSNSNTGKSNYKNPIAKEDEELAKAIELLNNSSNSSPSPNNSKTSSKKNYDDPMVLFKEQMTMIDSMAKANDPANQQNLKDANTPNIPDNVDPIPLKVQRAGIGNLHFNTVSVEEDRSLIKAIIDEDIKKGTMGGRLRIRILEDIIVGKKLLKKGSYLYALISGYEAQRVKLVISTVMIGDKVFPIKLSIYDNDGLEGLYIPASAFREFSKDLGANSASGVNIKMEQDPSTVSQLYMGALQRMFTSTSQAVTKSIRQNKANMKYGTMIYLFDPEDLKEEVEN